jgi:creatinine amidohydrolase
MKNNIYLSQLTWKEYEKVIKEEPVIIIPAGAVEQHGSHLPLLTDTILSTKLSEKVAIEIGGFIAEPFTYGTRSDLFSGGGESFLGTTSLSPQSFISMATNVLNEFCLDGFKRFIVLNGHYENAPLLREASREITQKHTKVSILFCNWWDIPDIQIIRSFYPGIFPGMDLEHAGFLETSLMLYLDANQVREQTLYPTETIKPSGYEIYPEYLNSLTRGSGSLSSAEGANAEVGKKLCDLVVAGIKKASNLAFINR